MGKNSWVFYRDGFYLLTEKGSEELRKRIPRTLTRRRLGTMSQAEFETSAKEEWTIDDEARLKP